MMNDILNDTLRQELSLLEAQLLQIELRAEALRATIAQYKETLAAEQRTAAQALADAQKAQDTALAALVAAKAAQDTLRTQETEQRTAEPAVETELSTVAPPSSEEEEEVEIELIYPEEEDSAEASQDETGQETEEGESPATDETAEDDEVEIELVYDEEAEDEEEEQEENIEAEKSQDSVEPAQQPASASTASILPPITDIRKAISLGDRFLFQRELFGGNGELMGKTLDKLNAMQSLAEAHAYLTKHFDWKTDSTAYELFHNLLKRRW